MSRHKSVLGVLVLGIFCFCAIGVGSASATTTERCTDLFQTSQTRTFYKDARCAVKEAAGEFHRTVLGGNTFTRWYYKSDNAFSTMIVGVTLTIDCEALTSSSGSAENLEVEKVMTVKGKEMVIEYGKCKVVAPAGKGCEVGSTIKTNKLKSSLPTVKEGEQVKVKLEPESGSKIATITVSGCSVSALNGEKPLEGSMQGVVPSSEPFILEFTAGSGSSLTLGSTAATYTGANGSEEAGTEEVLELIP